VTDAPTPPGPSHQPDNGVDNTPVSSVPVSSVPVSSVPVSSVPEARQPAPDEVGTDAESGPESESPPGETPPERATGRRGRVIAIVLAAVLGGLTVLCVGGAGIGLLLYRKASEPDRSTPGVVLRQYLDTTLNDRDDSRARQFTCRNSTGLGPVLQLRDDNMSKEKQYNVSIRTSPEGFQVQESGDRADVAVKLRLSVSTNGTFQEQIQTWRFTLRHESGWRVCSAEPIG
jgi:hypothetical protein